MGEKKIKMIKVISTTKKSFARRIIHSVLAEEKALAKVGREQTGLWFNTEQSLSYLDGTLPGDYGFDPLGVYDPEGKGGVVTQDWLRYAEIIHGRYAMLGAA